ncbi:MAG: hypothetical protein P4L35_08960 [Ignavibacteriaceae bacterium]|nr:hypothetical protein [Ignavibacteriaceae bacterium]
MNLINRPIGGYPELGLNKFTGHHKNALHLNTGRNCLEYILRANSHSKIYLPFYICESIFEPINKLDIKFDYYHIDENLDPVFTNGFNDDEVVLYVNYFGVKKRTVEKLAGNIKNLIIDNTHDFFCKPVDKIDTFYSARKFFGVPDGAYLYTKNLYRGTFEQDYSYDRMEHLLIQIDKGTEEGYESFSRNERLLMNQPIKLMSNLTKTLLGNIDFDRVRKQRKDNFLILHDKLGHINELKIEADEIDAPYVYPFLSAKGKEIKEKSVDKKVYIDTYWDSVLNKVYKNSVEARFTNELVPLPVSQMYSSEEIDLLGTFIRNY